MVHRSYLLLRTLQGRYIISVDYMLVIRATMIDMST